MKRGAFIFVFLLIGLVSTVCAQENQTSVAEQVKCIFINSVSDQKCYASYENKNVGCGGTGSCTVDVSGAQNTQITWKSTCGGYAYTVIDGQNNEIEFKCEPTPTAQTPSQVQPPTTAPVTTCIDNDGEDYYAKSYVKTESAEKWDSCSSDKQLEERICLDGHYDTISYACPYGCQDGACIKGEWTGTIQVNLVENTCEPCPASSLKMEVPCRCDSIKIYNFKVQLYDSTGNLISSKDTSNGLVEFSELKEGKYTLSLYADGYTPDKLDTNIGPNIGNHHTISLKKAGTSVGNIKIAVQESSGNTLYNAKVSVYDASGNLISSADTSSGAAVFYSLKEGTYIVIASAPDHTQNKIEFKIIGSESDYLTIRLESTQNASTKPEPLIYWFRNAYWQCQDGYEEKQGGETSCKPPELWRSYAVESCKSHCNKETGKCEFSSFKFYNGCPGSSIIEPSVCGNGLCEGGEGEICEIMAIACEQGKKCEASSNQPAKCYFSCEQDCKKTPEISAHLEEKFKMQMSQQVRFSDYSPLEIKFNDFFLPKCAVQIPTTSASSESPSSIEKYNAITGEVISIISRVVTETPTTTTPIETHASAAVASASCEGAEPYAVLQIKLENPEVNKRYTEVAKMKLGEKKKISDAYSHFFVISFLDFDASSKTGVFLVSKNVADFDCPKNCACDFTGKTTECKKIEKCSEKTMLCPDGVCREKCEVTNITTECKFGCFYQDKCLPYGLRINGLYCSISNDMKTQISTDQSCENNFECSTNLCLDGKCISSSLIQKIISWFKRLFG